MYDRPFDKPHPPGQSFTILAPLALGEPETVNDGGGGWAVTQTVTRSTGEFLQYGAPAVEFIKRDLGRVPDPPPAKEPYSIVRTDDFLFNDASLVPRRGLEQVQIAPNRKKN